METLQLGDVPEVSHRSLRRYENVHSFVSTVAEKGFGIAIDEQAKERLLQLCRLTRAIDLYIDDAHAAGTTHETHQEVLQALQSFDVFAAGYPALTPKELGTDKHSALCEITEQIFGLDEAISTTHSPSRYMAYRRMEGRLTAELLATVLPEDVTSHPNYPLFRRALSTAGDIGNLVDSVADMSKDYQQTRIEVEPTAALRLRMLGKAVIESVSLPVSLYKPSILGQALSAAVGTYKGKSA